MNYLSRLDGVFDHCYSKEAVFRPFCRSDGFPLFVATQNPEFNRYLLWPAPEEEAKIFTQADKLIREHNLNKSVVLSICERKTGTWIGTGIIRTLKDGVELGLHLHPNVWNKGIIFMAGDALLQILADYYPDIPIYVRIRTGNQKMEALTSYFHLDKLPEVNLDSHPTEGTVELGLYRLNLETRPKYTGLTQY